MPGKTCQHHETRRFAKSDRRKVKAMDHEIMIGWFLIASFALVAFNQG